MTTTALPTTAQPTAPSSVNPAWVEEALCPEVDPELFFPPTKGGNAIKDSHYDNARRICQRCPVKTQCLEAAMAFEDGQSHYSRYGMFGGLTPRERADLAAKPARNRR